MAYEDVGNDTPILETDLSNKKISYLGLLSDIDSDDMTNINPDVESFSIISDNVIPHDSVERFGSAVVGIVSAKNQSTSKDTSVSPQQLPVSFDHIGAFIDMDSAEVCSYDAMAARKSIADFIKDTLHLNHGTRNVSERFDFGNERKIVVYDDAGMPTIAKGNNSLYLASLQPDVNSARKVVFWTDVDVSEQDKAYVQTYLDKDPFRIKFERAAKKTIAEVRDGIRGNAPIHIGYLLQGSGRELLLPLATLRKTDTGCEFLVPANQEMNSEAYNKPRLLETLRSSLNKIFYTGSSDTVEATNTALLPFVEALIEESKKFPSSKVFTDTLEYINGLREEDAALNEFYKNVLFNNKDNPWMTEKPTIVTVGARNETITLELNQRIIARSKQFMTKIGAKEQQTEAIITEGVLNEQLQDGFRTETFTVYMGPAKAVFGDVRYYPVYEVTKDEFGQLSVRRYKEDLKTLEAASTDDMSALHMLFVKK